MLDNPNPDIEKTASLPIVSTDERIRRQAIKQGRSVDGMEKRWQDHDRSALEAAISANAPPVRSESRCSVCQNPHRLWIERQLIHGIAYKAIAQSLPNVNVDSFRRALRTHYQNHMDLEGAQIRALMENEADLLQQNYEEGIQGAFNYKAALDVLIRKGFSDALDSVTTVEPKDIIKLMELADKMNAGSAIRIEQEAKAAINIFMEAIRNVFADELDKDMSELLSTKIVAEVKRLRQQNDLEAKIENHMRYLPNGRSVDSD